MAALDSSQIRAVFVDGMCSRTALYSLKDVSADDVVDVGGEFRVVDRAAFVADSNALTGEVTTVNGTELTLPAGPINDGIWLLVVGVAL